MELTPEERHKIYEEEKAHLEALEKPAREPPKTTPAPSTKHPTLPKREPAPSAKSPGTGQERKLGAFLEHLRDNRIRASVIAIAWGIVLLVFFNFFYDYIAYYHSISQDGITVWERTTYFSSSYYHWLPLLTATLLIMIACHVVLIMHDSYSLRQILSIIMGVSGLATVVTLLAIFPFDFHIIPSTGAANAIHIWLRVALALISLGVGINVLVRLIKFIISLAKGRADYDKAI